MCFLVAASVTDAQDFQTGLAAAQVGDMETALENWHPLAEAISNHCFHSQILLKRSGTMFDLPQ